MTAIPQNRLAPPPPRIAGPLRLVARRQWSVLATRGVVLTLLASLSILLAALLVIGLVPHVPYGGRVATASGVWAAVLVVAIYFLRPAMRKRTLVGTAMDVERRLAATGVADTHERIASALELSQDADPRFAGSPALVQHLVRQAEADAALVRPERLVSAKPVGRLALLLVPMLVTWVALAILLPPSRFLRPLFHLLLPWREAPAFLSDVVVTPGDLTVAQGDPIDIEATVNPRDLADKTAEVSRAALFVQDLSGTATAKDAAELAMARAGPRSFKFTRTADKTFRYRVGTEAGDSPWYTATVEPVPAVRSIAVRYDYPAYAQLPSRTDANKDDGAIDALQNTKVTVTVESGADLTAASKLVVTDKLPAADPVPGGLALKAEGRDLPLAKVADGRYETSFVLGASGTYRVRLTNGFKRQNRDAEQERPITARPDEKPTITIAAPTQELAVRPDETVPVAFRATDDFGVAKVELLAQVDGGETIALPVTFAEKSPKLLAGRHPLAVGQIIEQAKAKANGGKPSATDPQKITYARSISYWLRVTDVRDPAPQSAESGRQTLRVDHRAESLAARQDRAEAKDLTEAIRTAIRRLEEVRPEVETFKWSGRDQQGLSADARRRAEEVKDRLEKTGNELAKEAGEHAAGAFAATAAAAKRTAEAGILGAADAMARVDLHNDRFEARKAEADVAAAQVAQATKELKDLLAKVEVQARLVDAQHKLEDLAKRQAEVAKAMAEAAEKDKNPQQDRQNQLNDQTRQAVEQAQLYDRKAEEQAKSLQQLIEKVQDLQQQQEQAADQTHKQGEMAAAAEQAKSVAQKQAALNDKVGAFARDEQKSLEPAGARPPEPKQLADIVKDLNAAKLQQAADQQRDAARRLEETARQLQDRAKAEKPPLVGDGQKAVEQAKADAQQAAQAVEQAKARQPQAAEAREQSARAADRAREAAKGNDAEAQKDAAAQAAEAAKQAARTAEAAREQAAGAQEKAQAAAKAPDAAAREAAKQADETAREAQAAAAEAKAAAGQAEQSAAQAAKAQEAKNAAEEQRATARAGERAERAGRKAAEAADKAAQAAGQLAQSKQQSAKQVQADARQQAKHSAQTAADAATQLAKQQQALADEVAKQATAAAKAQEQGAVPPAEAAARQRQLAEQAAKAARRAEQLEQSAEQSANAPLARRADAAGQALDEARAAQQQAAEAQQNGDAPKAADAQQAAREQLARAEQALRGQPPAHNPGGQPPAEQPAGEGATGEAPKPGEGQPGAKGESAKGQGQSGQPGQQPGQGEQPAAAGEPKAGAESAAGQWGQPPRSPQQARQQAAQAAAEAQNAQQQASQGNRAAARQAADALARAAQALAQATGQQGTPGQGQAKAQGKQPGEQPGEGEDEDQPPSQTPGQSNNPKQGIAAQQTGGPTDVPAAVTDLGITPGDWAKLGPLQQKDLAAAAQQAGPPEYQSMVKNYYVRIARMQARGQGGK